MKWPGPNTAGEGVKWPGANTAGDGVGVPDMLGKLNPITVAAGMKWPGPNTAGEGVKMPKNTATEGSKWDPSAKMEWTDVKEDVPTSRRKNGKAHHKASKQKNSR